jgi:hypothetical protein
MKTIATVKTIAALFLLVLCLGVQKPVEAQSPARPDLKIPGIGARNYTTTTILGGRSVTLYWSKAIIFVYNAGNATSAPCHVRLEVRDWATGAVRNTYIANVPSVAPGVYQEVDVIASRNMQDFTNFYNYLFGFVDCNFEVAESCETNNTGFSGPGGQGG